MPCWELFEKQDIKYQKKVLTSNCLVVGMRQLHQWVGINGYMQVGEK